MCEQKGKKNTIRTSQRRRTLKDPMFNGINESYKNDDDDENLCGNLRRVFSLLQPPNHC